MPKICVCSLKECTRAVAPPEGGLNYSSSLVQLNNQTSIIYSLSLVYISNVAIASFDLHTGRQRSDKFDKLSHQRDRSSSANDVVILFQLIAIDASPPPPRTPTIELILPMQWRAVFSQIALDKSYSGIPKHHQIESLSSPSSSSPSSMSLLVIYILHS